ncbi:hypothetical protein [Nonomuraea sp. NPDC049141]|uniref:hypothetical protein n=1 Tax=Nonomuraea sp. NPDC049141 TaxID=3155500 RepID=UPI0034047A54
MTATDILARHMPLPVWDMATGDVLDGELIYGPTLEPHHVTVLLEGWMLLVPHTDLAGGLTRVMRVELGGGLLLSMFPHAGGEYVVWELSQPAAGDERVTVLLVKVQPAWLLPYLVAAGEVAPAGVELSVVDWDSAAAEWFGGPHECDGE